MKKILTSIIAVFIFAVLIIPQSSYASTAVEIRAQIDALKKLIEDLEMQLSKVEGGQKEWCHDFNKNLKTGDRGDAVFALQTVLKKEGFNAIENMESDEKAGTFGKGTFSAVVDLQEKYGSEILRPLGLRRGTGYVGTATRRTLNRLYGCDR